MIIKNKQTGFTIVELLIVIVVIGILATITIVAFNGVQQRAKNTTMISAVTSYAKAIQAYREVNGTFPSFFPACLGEGYGNGFSKTEGTNTNGQCQSANAIKENTSFNTQIKEFTGGKFVTPPMDTIGASANWNRGIHYNNWSGYGGYYLGYVLVGNENCPEIGGLIQTASANQTGGRICVAIFPGQ